MSWIVAQVEAIPPQWRAAIGSWCKSLGLGLFTILGVMYGMASSENKTADIPTFLWYCDVHWQGVLLGFIFSGGTATYRGKQAHDAIKNDTVIAP